MRIFRLAVGLDEMKDIKSGVLLYFVEVRLEISLLLYAAAVGGSVNWNVTLNGK